MREREREWYNSLLNLSLNYYSFWRKKINKMILCFVLRCDITDSKLLDGRIYKLTYFNEIRNKIYCTQKIKVVLIIHKYNL